MKSFYENKHVWITGASSGIGKALTQTLSSYGARLIISSRREEALKEVRETCAFPEKIGILPLDLADGDSLPEKVAIAIGMAGGQIDMMVHNGGISQRSLVKDTDISVDRKVMEIDYFGTVALTKALLPHFLENQSGHFAVVTSLMGVFSSPMRSGYCAAKHALHGFFDALRAEHHEDNIYVSIICPGFIRTEISKNALVGDGSKQETMDQATDKGLTPEQCAQRMAKAISKRKPEIYVGKKEILAIYLKRWMPGVLRRIIRKAAVT
ncbi:MAG: SDR family oxidoreductase [Flavobacteriales bacterium]|nr:SDR family oxidoreductase [Flavobacteriales bacterium]